MSRSRPPGRPEAARRRRRGARRAPTIASCTRTRAAAEHFWPAYVNADATIAGTASSRSASESTITQFFPPISETTRLTCRCGGVVRAAASTISRPTGREPVNAMVVTAGWRTSAAPTSPSPGRRCSTSGGTPPRSGPRRRPARLRATARRLQTTALPLASAPAAMPVGIASGKFQGEITAHTPRGR